MADQYVPLQYNDLLVNFSVYLVLLIAAVIAPVLEELIFRFPLKWKRNYLMQILNGLSGNNSIKNWWNRNYRWVFYLSAVIFGVVHLGNFENEWSAAFILLIPVFTLSQLIAGFTFGYIRNRLGFLWAAAFHGFFNLIFVLLPYLIFDGTKLFKINNARYQTEAVQLIYKSTPNSFVTMDKTPDERYKMVKAENSSVPALTEFLFEEKYYSEKVQLVNFNFKSESGISREEMLQLLKTHLKLEKEKP